MLRTSESETEILLGNKQLLGIFLAVALLLGVSFTGGFLIGRGGLGKNAAATPGTSAAPASGSGGQTRTLDGETTLPAAASGGADSEAALSGGKNSSETVQRADGGGADAERASQTPEPVLGAHKRAAAAAPAPVNPTVESAVRTKDPEAAGFTPRTGTEYLQVAAVGHEEAVAVADVLHKKGFRAHAVPKPGNAKLYRVIIGPVKDAGELATTRDALRKTGFREVIVQRY